MVNHKEQRDTSQPTAEYVAMQLREEITNGELKPGTRLKEIQLAEQFNISRNTLRDALRQLQYIGLVTLSSNRSAKVSIMSEAQIRDIYHVRRILERAGIEASVDAPSDRLQNLLDSVNASQSLHNAQHWKQFGTSSLTFHHAIVSLLNSALIDQYFADILAQTRLIFADISDQGALQQRWLEPDKRIASLIISGKRTEACAFLDQYLARSQAMVIDSIRQRSFDKTHRNKEKTEVHIDLPSEDSY